MFLGLIFPKQISLSVYVTVFRLAVVRARANITANRIQWGLDWLVATNGGCRVQKKDADVLNEHRSQYM